MIVWDSKQDDQLNFSRRNLEFLLFELFQDNPSGTLPYYPIHDREIISQILDSTTLLSEKYMRPFFSVTDRNPPEFKDGSVRVHESIPTFYQALSETGLLRAGLEKQDTGEEMSDLIYGAVDFILGNGHNGFEMFLNLSRSGARILQHFDKDPVVKRYLQDLVDGSATATMCLTESEAGSSLGNIRSVAQKRNEKEYLLSGQKIFISAGDHQVTPNIIHLVLARTVGAPEGVKGLSLFMVPTKLKTEPGGDWIDNDIQTTGIFEKMGQKSTPAVQLDFGTNHNCIAYLLGEPGKGLTYMFQMMNDSRLNVGLAGAYIASAAYFSALRFARDRRQGKRLNGENDPSGVQVPIIQHPDVRRMLHFQQAAVEGILSLVFQCLHYRDLFRAGTGNNEKYSGLIEFLTPLIKSTGAEWGFQSVNQSMQVMGGYGYLKDFAVEQLARDIRILSIYEGTNGIQAQTLLKREIIQKDAAPLLFWKEEVLETVQAARADPSLQQYGNWLLLEVEEFEALTGTLLEKRGGIPLEILLRDASLYSEYLGILNLAWQWLKQAQIACKNSKMVSDEEQQAFYQSKFQTMKYFFHYELVKTGGLKQRLMDEEWITVLEERERIKEDENAKASKINLNQI